MSAGVPKAALYYFPTAIWPSAPLMALEEKGYGPDEVDLKLVDLAKGENFTPQYLRLNPHGTVPTLVVPLHNTLSPEIESRYKALQDTKSIVEFIDKSRSTQSRTHTTSSAPSPSLSPATIAFSAISDKVITLLHSEPADPNALLYLSARDEASLRALAKARVPMLSARRNTLAQLLEDSAADRIHVSEKTRAFWTMKKTATENFLDVFKDAEKPSSALDDVERQKREAYLKDAKLTWAGLKEVLPQLNQELIGPYVLGDQLSVADLHLAAWLARIVMLSGGTIEEDGNTVVGKLEAHVGPGFTLPKGISITEARRRAGLPLPETETDERQSRLAAFWDAMKERPSFQKIYADGLH
ncbi:uncharacterized protein LAESUDRAFT_729918 [Laetiporus sulphureus 93-53]|uniref:GST N-terminal domain-containing protein n=1 Tax=Laetiporus sulphureus 93-53 TaxID=1314785 RepID=A0A165CEL1_9APHY|nr:uncharacterized protein LAESUDRAFT_729918 [Laetiporus sulphureus 93-53]KZT02674.1 hypothetical protein LAESUDRAFT_729918 [Laetiporus sulphureus 93-53]